MLSPLLVFATYIGISGVAHELDSPKMFSSLVVISLVASPLIHVFQALPAIGSAHACFKRILAFLQMPERRHEAEPTTGTEGCSKSLSHVSQDGICVSLRGVALGWASHKPILRNVNLEVKKRLPSLVPSVQASPSLSSPWSVSRNSLRDTRPCPGAKLHTADRRRGSRTFLPRDPGCNI